MINIDVEFWKNIKSCWQNNNVLNHLNKEVKNEIKSTVKSRNRNRIKKVSAIDFINGEDEEI
ncbi:hypothetical protein [Terrisporobacter vanillatitrophus]|uniref:hypothetical protein n=1 Tax=Terrisporobacter vanillatitrophus TaxID=3058402 RepID=UPI00336726CF